MGYQRGIILLIGFSLCPTFTHGLIKPALGPHRISKILPKPGSEIPIICDERTGQEIKKCLRSLYPSIASGFPWGGGDDKIAQDPHLRTVSNNTIGDPLDPINYACRAFDDFDACLQLHSINKLCLLGGHGDLRPYATFSYVCRVEARTLDVVHSLRCLDDTRVLDLLIFHLADEYGTDAVTQLGRGTVNALFRFLNNYDLMASYFVNPISLFMDFVEELICLPQRTLYQQVASLIADRCGSHAEDLVKGYYRYVRKFVAKLLNGAGITESVCEKSQNDGDKKSSRERQVINDRIWENHTKPSRESFQKFLDQYSPGTALGTVYGRYVRQLIKEMPPANFCRSVLDIDLLYQPCSLLSLDEIGKGTFDVLQFAHSMRFPFTTAGQRGRMNVFRFCWVLLQQICGPEARYVAYNYAVTEGSWHIQSVMEDLPCEWQDMLIRRYIQASEKGNIWPTGYNAPGRPMFLSPGIYSFGSITRSMSDLVQTLGEGVREISGKCGKRSGRAVDAFYQRVKYYLYNILQFYYKLQLHTN